MPTAEPLLLDTHAWVWLVAGNLRARCVFEAAGSYRIAAITIWELGMLEAKNRLRFSPNATEWVEQHLRIPVELIPLTPDIALLSCNLPGDFHHDPADRMIVATALVSGLRLATADKVILDYAQSQRLRVLPLR